MEVVRGAKVRDARVLISALQGDEWEGVFREGSGER